MSENKYTEVRNISLENLEEYINSLIENNQDYNTTVDAVAKAGLAAMYIMSHKLGITGFQASCALWAVIREWQYSSNKTGMRMINFDDLLQPQYKDKMTTIPKDVWENLQKEASDNLSRNKDAHPAVIAHWQSIVQGIVPFGLKVEM